MSSQREENFDEATTFTDTHDVQAKTGIAKWVNKFLPVICGPKGHCRGTAMALSQAGVVLCNCE